MSNPNDEYYAQNNSTIQGSRQMTGAQNLLR